MEHDGSIALYAISYDPVETLARFSRVHDITYPLLSDVGSEVIERLGVLNVTIEAERAAYGRPMEERHKGIPYPGTFSLDESGVVTGKRFERSHRIRPTGRSLLRSLIGDDGSPPEVSAEASSPGVRVAAWLDTSVVHANQLQELHVRLETEPGVHLYTEPVPQGFSALAVELSGDDRLRAEQATTIEGSEFHVEGLPDTFYVVEGIVDLAVPFVLLSNRDTAGDPTRDVSLELTVSYQACTSEMCFMPERLTLELPIREEPNPGYETADPAALEPLVLRRIVEQPRDVEELLILVNAALEGVEVSVDELAEVLEGLEERGMVLRAGSGRWSMPD